MLYAHQRLAELWTKQQKEGRKLSLDEEIEMVQCLRANADYAYKMAGLHNKSLMASMTNDYDWQHEICKEIEHLEHTYGPKKKPTL